LPVVPTNVPTISDLRGIERRYYCVRFVLPPLLAEHGDQGQAIKNAEKLRNSYQDTDYSSHNPCTHVDRLIKEITDPEVRKEILKGSSSKASIE